MTEEIRRACRLAIDAGYRNIDIDSSTLVDLSKPTATSSSARTTVAPPSSTALIRSLEADGVTISVGGEIGEVGKENSTGRGAPRLPRRLPTRARRRAAPGAVGISKVSVQTGTSPRRHAAARRRGRRGEARLRGPPRARRGRPDRTASRAPCSTARRRCRMSCSTVSPPSRPPRSTSPPASRTPCSTTRRSRPSSTSEIEAWFFANAADERKPDQTDQQFVYTTRKKAIGPFKRELWDLPTKDEILAAQRRKIVFLFTELGVNGVARDGRRLHPPGRGPSPDARRLREAVAAARTCRRVPRGSLTRAVRLSIGPFARPHDFRR